MSMIANDNLLQLRHPGINNTVTRTFPRDSAAVLTLINATDQEDPLVLHANGPRPLSINLLPRRTNPNLSVVSLELHNSLLLLYPEVLRHYRMTLPCTPLTKDQDNTCLISIGLVTPEPATTVTNDDPAPVNEMSPDNLPELLITEPGKHETDQQPAVHSPAAPAPITPVTSPRVTSEPATTVTPVITNDDPAPVNEMTADKLPELLITEPGKHETDQQPAVHSPAAPAPTTPVTSPRVTPEPATTVTPVITNDDPAPVNEMTADKLPELLITEPGKHETDQQPAVHSPAAPAPTTLQ